MTAQTPPMRIGLAGCGKMGSAMVRAWHRSAIFSTLDILDPQVNGEISEISDVRCFQETKEFSARAANWDVLVLAVKPQSLNALAQSLALPDGLPVLSIMAGKTLAALARAFGDRPMIRAMPNTPAAIGRGISVAVGNGAASGILSKAEQLLAALGAVRIVDDEALLDAVTGLSGSGPAYVFYFIESLAEAGIAAGLPAALARDLARLTVIGSGALAEQDPAPPDALRRNVTSPNGTTAAGLDILMDGRFDAVLRETVARAAARSRELAD